MSYNIMKDETITLREPGPEQRKVLNQYRLTESFRNAYGNHMLACLPQRSEVRNAAAAIKKFKGVDEVDIAQWKDVIIDLIYSKYVLDFMHWEYFVYGLEDKSIAERLEFIPQRKRLTYGEALNMSREESRKILYKYITYQLHPSYFKRDMCYLNSVSQKKEFFDFCRRHPRFIVKPVNRGVGRGVEIINCGDYENLEDLFADLYAKEDKMLCEELIVCEDSMKAIHPQSVNSIRIFTYLTSVGEPTIVCAWLKAGQGDAVIDNGTAGGVLAAIDHKTGIVYTDAADEANHVYPTHPDTGFVFKGFQIPRWEELIRIVLELSSMFPGTPLVGWDVALSKDRGWQLIEGNHCGMISLIQVPTKKGFRKQIETAIEWDMHRRKLQRTK